MNIRPSNAGLLTRSWKKHERGRTMARSIPRTKQSNSFARKSELAGLVSVNLLNRESRPIRQCHRALKDAPAAVERAFYKQLRFLEDNLLHPSLHAKKYDEAADLWQARVNRA